MHLVTRIARGAGRVVVGLLAAGALLGLLVGLPCLLITAIGWPLPHHIPTLDTLQDTVANPLTDDLLLHLLGLLGWIAWATFVRDLIAASITLSLDAAEARRAGRPLRVRHDGGPLRIAAAILLGALITALLTQHARGVHAPTVTGHDPHAARPPAAATPDTAPDTGGTGAGTGTAPHGAGPDRPQAALRVAPHDPTTTLTPITVTAHRATPTEQSDAEQAVYTVVKGDDLWDIAARQLGDPTRWREIYTANRGLPQPDGYALGDPDEIHIGWQLRLPATAHTPPTNPPEPETTPDTPPAPTPAPSSPRAAPDTAPASSPPQDHETTARRGAEGVTMPSGAWISTGLAAGLATTALAASLYRRQRRRIRQPTTTTRGPRPSPIPPRLAGAVAAGTAALRDADPPPPATRRTPSPQRPATSGSPPPVPAVDAAFAVDQTDAELGLEDLTRAGLALSGPGAASAVRAALAAALTAGRLALPDHRVSVHTTTDTLHALLPDHAPRHDPMPDALHLHDGPDTALLAIETELLSRRRLVTATSHSDDPRNTDSNDDEAYAWVDILGHALLILPAEPRHLPRIRAVLALGADLRIGVLLLGEAPTIPSLALAADAAVTAHADLDHPPRRVAALEPAELADILDLVHAAAPPVTDQQTAIEDEERQGQAGLEASTATDTAPEEVDGHLCVETDFPACPPQAGTDNIVHLRLLGPASVTLAGAEVEGITGTRYAILAYLATRPHGATRDEILEALYPDPRAASGRFRVACTETRERLRHATGTQNSFILNEDRRYRLDATVLDIDLWRMLGALHDARTVPDGDDEALLAALTRTVDVYDGDFGDGLDYPWVTERATTYRAHAVDALARIAEIHETDRPDAAIAALTRAIDLDPICEELYQRAMRIHGRLGRADAVRRTMSRCREALAEIQTEPSDTTDRIARRQLHATEPAR